jgi:putative redox protein
LSDQWLAEVSWAEGYLFVGTDLQGHAVVYDSGEQVQRGISPMRAVLTSLGACTGMDIVAILKKRKQKLTSLKILLSGTRPEHGYPRGWKTIHVKYVLSGENLETKFVEEAVNDSDAKFCSVSASLRPGVTITHSYEIVPKP